MEQDECCPCYGQAEHALVPLRSGTPQLLSPDRRGLWADQPLIWLISGNPDFQAVSEPPQKKVASLEPDVRRGVASGTQQLPGSWGPGSRLWEGPAEEPLSCVCLTRAEGDSQGHSCN